MPAGRFPATCAALERLGARVQLCGFKRSLSGADRDATPPEIRAAPSTTGPTTARTESPHTTTAR